MILLRDATYNFRAKIKVSRHKTGAAAWSARQREVRPAPASRCTDAGVAALCEDHTGLCHSPAPSAWSPRLVVPKGVGVPVKHQQGGKRGDPRRDPSQQDTSHVRQPDYLQIKGIVTLMQKAN